MSGTSNHLQTTDLKGIPVYQCSIRMDAVPDDRSVNPNHRAAAACLQNLAEKSSFGEKCAVYANVFYEDDPRARDIGGSDSPTAWRSLLLVCDGNGRLGVRHLFKPVSK